MNLSKPGKSASRPLRLIEDSVETRMTVNIELGYWIDKLFPIQIYSQEEKEDWRKSIKPSRFLWIMNLYNCQSESASWRHYFEISNSYTFKKDKIKKIVGEFY